MATLHSCVLLLTLVIVALSLDLASAKPLEGPAVRTPLSKGVYPLRRRFVARGCSSFGHSCFGGHGKRSDEEFPAPDYQQEAEQERAVDRALDGRPGDLVSLLRQWLQLQSYRRLADGNPN